VLVVGDIFKAMSRVKLYLFLIKQLLDLSSRLGHLSRVPHGLVPIKDSALEFHALKDLPGPYVQSGTVRSGLNYSKC